MADHMHDTEYHAIVRRLIHCNPDDLANIIARVIHDRDMHLRERYDIGSFTIPGCNGDTCDGEAHHTPGHIGVPDRICTVTINYADKDWWVE